MLTGENHAAGGMLMLMLNADAMLMLILIQDKL